MSRARRKKEGLTRLLARPECVARSRPSARPAETLGRALFAATCLFASAGALPARAADGPDRALPRFESFPGNDLLPGRRVVGIASDHEASASRMLVVMRERASVVAEAYPLLSEASTVNGLRFDDISFRIGGIRCVRRRRLRMTGLGQRDERCRKDEQVFRLHEGFGAASEPGGSADLSGVGDWFATIGEVPVWLLLVELVPGVGAPS